LKDWEKATLKDIDPNYKIEEDSDEEVK